MQEKQQSASWRKQTLYAQISPKSQATEAYISSTTTMKPTRATTTLSCNVQMKKWEKANIGSFRYHNNCGSTRPSMTASKGNKLPPSFSGFKSQRFLNESSHDGVSGTDNDEQSLNNSASVFYLWLLQAFSWFQNGSMLFLSKRRAFIIEDWCFWKH